MMKKELVMLYEMELQLPIQLINCKTAKDVENAFGAHGFYKDQYLDKIKILQKVMCVDWQPHEPNNTKVDYDEEVMIFLEGSWLDMKYGIA